MTRVHDMGGRYGDGKINPDLGKEDIFKAKWHARALAVTLATGSLKKWNLDMSRHARECLPPKEYAIFSYYEKWISALANLLVEKGVINSDQFLNPIINDHPLSKKKLKAQLIRQRKAVSNMRDLFVLNRFAMSVNLGLDIVDGVTDLHVQGGGLASQSLGKNLHARKRSTG